MAVQQPLQIPLSAPGLASTSTALHNLHSLSAAMPLGTYNTSGMTTFPGFAIDVPATPWTLSVESNVTRYLSDDVERLWIETQFSLGNARDQVLDKAGAKKIQGCGLVLDDAVVRRNALGDACSLGPGGVCGEQMLAYLKEWSGEHAGRIVDERKVCSGVQADLQEKHRNGGLSGCSDDELRFLGSFTLTEENISPGPSKDRLKFIALRMGHERPSVAQKPAHTGDFTTPSQLAFIAWGTHGKSVDARWELIVPKVVSEWKNPIQVAESSRQKARAMKSDQEDKASADLRSDGAGFYALIAAILMGVAFVV